MVGEGERERYLRDHRGSTESDMPLCYTDAREHLRAHDNQVVRARTGWATAMDVHASVVLQLNQPQLGAEGKKTSAPKQL
jgi:hypothetical protein